MSKVTFSVQVKSIRFEKVPPLERNHKLRSSLKVCVVCPIQPDNYAYFEVIQSLDHWSCIFLTELYGSFLHW